MAETTDYGQCDWRSPGHTEPHAAERGWNGTDVCWDCWHWNKVDRNHATYWLEHINQLDIDMHDMSAYFPRAFGGGTITEESRAKSRQLATLLTELRDYAKGQLDSMDQANA